MSEPSCVTPHFLGFSSDRDNGCLSQYVAFIDVYLGRSFVQDACMRVSYPYYLGPATWRLLHTLGEVTCDLTQIQQLEIIDVFKRFMRFFAKTYSCPYCR